MFYTKLQNQYFSVMIIDLYIILRLAYIFPFKMCRINV